MNFKFQINWGILLIPLFLSSLLSCQKEAPIPPRDWIYRAVPSHLGGTPKSEFFILVGSDLAFGTDLEDQETMAHLMDQQSLHYKVYNRAHPGASALDVLSSIKNKYYQKDIREESGVVALVIPHSELKSYLEILPKFRAALGDGRYRLGVICEWPKDIQGLPSECLGAKFEDDILSLESIKALFQKF